MADDEQEPYVDPNSGRVPQPGSYAHTPWSEGDDDADDPNPDPGGAEAVFATDGQSEATPVDDEGEPIDDGELEDADEDELEGNDPNPDPGGVESAPVEGVQTEATPVDGASPDEAANANPGADEQVAGPQTEALEEPTKGASRAAWVEFARSKGAPEEELGDEGLKRDELAAKYGSA